MTGFSPLSSTYHSWRIFVPLTGSASHSGTHDEALDWFEKAVDSGRRRYEWDEMEPAFEPLSDEYRFKAALQRQRDLRREMEQNTAVLLGQ